LESPRRKKIAARLLPPVCLALGLCLADTAGSAEQIHLLPSAFQQGDLILRRGEGIMSDIARHFSATEKRFSHVGIIVDYKRKAYVVHSVHEHAKGFDGVVIEKLEDFLKEASDWAVYRLRLKKVQQQKLASTAIHYAHSKIPFDSQFDLGSQQAMYCTEFIWRVSGEVAKPNPILAASIKAGSRYISIEDIYRQDNAVLIESMQTK
jgi:hypothetical protein